MTMQQFIQANKPELDAAITRRVPGVKLNNHERQQWILNDEGLYLWAKSEGVRI
jgi:hypothetical protein